MGTFMRFSARVLRKGTFPSAGRYGGSLTMTPGKGTGAIPATVWAVMSMAVNISIHDV